MQQRRILPGVSIFPYHISTSIGLRTPKHTKRNKFSLSINADPAQRQHPARKRTQSPRHNGPKPLRDASTAQPPKEARRNRHDQRVQPHALAQPQAVARVRGDVEVGDDVAEEGGEGARREDEEEPILVGCLVEERARLALRGQHTGAAQQRRDGEQRRGERDEADCAHGPGEAARF